MNKTESVPQPVKLFVGMISPEICMFDTLRRKLVELYGNIDLESPVMEWGYTDHYSKEMGGDLKRKFIFFEKLISPETIAEIKLKTSELERQYLKENNPPIPPLPKGGEGGFKGGRRINLDPGYLDSARVVLVSTKDYSHRVYLGKGIYGETTLIYSGKNYQTLPYTYPDFRTQEYFAIFKMAREKYKTAVKEQK
ncbi:MAG: DUF4416 family protein [Nitrospirae bacterium]|nr:DUF4416 family protein [Nitrospirota bacterium]